MPAFKGVLNEAEIDSVIAFFQSKWSDEIYVGWQERQQPSKGFVAIKPSPKQDKILNYLRKLAEGKPIGELI